jgi:hypothetical protein
MRRTFASVNIRLPLVPAFPGLGARTCARFGQGMRENSRDRLGAKVTQY